MRKIKILALLSIVALLLAVPAVASAQVAFPATIAGTAMVDDEVAADDTMITAMVGGAKVGSAMVMDGKFAILVAPATADDHGGMVSFMIGDRNAMSSMDVTLAPGVDAMGVMLEAMSGPPPAVVHASLYEVWPSGQTGMATLTEAGDETRVDVSLNPGAMMGTEAGVYMGSCDAMGELAHGLGMMSGMMSDGMMMMEMMEMSGSMVGMDIATLQDGNHVIAVKTSGGMATVCGQIPDADGNAAMPALPQGPQGEKGEDGADGDRGARGPQGIPGEAGHDGHDGHDGADGAPGAAGSTGPRGADGAAGATGPRGAEGAAGATGPRGPAGAMGASGGGGLAIVALIVGIVGIVAGGVAIVMGRSS